MRHRDLLSATVVVLLSFVAGSAAAAPDKGEWQVLDKLEVGGEGEWDFLKVDPVARRLYVPRTSSVMVIDLDKKAVVGEVANTPGVHDVALVPRLNRGFTANGKDGSITIFDLKTLATIGSLKAGENPDYALYDDTSKRVFVFNNKSGDVTVVDPAKGTVVSTIPIGGELELAASDDKGTIFVAVEDKHELAVIDTKKMAVRARWPVAPAKEPVGVAIDTKSRRLFVGCGSKHLVVMDSTNGKVLTTLPIGAGLDGLVFDPVKKRVFAPGGKDGNLTVIKADGPDTFSVVETIPTQMRARTIALDAKNHRLYLPVAEFGPVPAATKEVPKPRAPLLANSFRVLVVGPRK